MHSKFTLIKALNGGKKRYLPNISLKELLKVVASFIVFISSIYIYTLVNSYILENKIDERFMLEGFENIVVKIPSYHELLSMTTMRFVIVLVAIITLLLFVIIIGGLSWKPLSLISLVLSSFIIIIIISILQAYCIFTVPKVEFGIVEAEFENVFFYDVDFVGINEYNEEVKISSSRIWASYVKVFRAYDNMTRPQLKIYYKPVDLDELLKNTKTYLNLTDVVCYDNEVDERFSKISIFEIKFKTVKYERILSLKDVRISEQTGAEASMTLLSLSSTILMSTYVSVGFKKIYYTTTKFAIGVAAIVYLILFIITMFMGLV